MATPVEVPKLGNTVEECLIARWVKRKGDSVIEGDVVVEIETDKATFEVAAPLSGTLLDTFFPEGALVPVYINLFVVGEPGENTDVFRPSSTAQAAGLPEAEASSAPMPDVRAVASSAPQPTGAAFSPRARRFAEEHNFHPHGVAGSGPGGRVMEEDVRALFYSGGAARSAVSAKPQVGQAIRPLPVERREHAPTRAANIRGRIARRMRESLATTAQYTMSASADATGLMAIRARIKASANGPAININDLVNFCTIHALRQMPDLNSEYIDDRVVKHSEIHLGFACDTPRGLMVPVVRNAGAMDIAGLARRTRELTAQAVQGNISPDDLAGATFTVSNLGGLGIETFTPLLNPPQVAILGVGAIRVAPVRRSGTVEFIDTIELSLTCDHQVIDGAPGARFLKVVREKIENVESLCTI